MPQGSFPQKSAVLSQYDGFKVWSTRSSSFQGIEVSTPDTTYNCVALPVKKDLNLVLWASIAT